MQTRSIAYANTGVNICRSRFNGKHVVTELHVVLLHSATTEARREINLSKNLLPRWSNEKKIKKKTRFSPISNHDPAKQLHCMVMTETSITISVYCTHTRTYNTYSTIRLESLNSIASQFWYFTSIRRTTKCLSNSDNICTYEASMAAASERAQTIESVHYRVKVRGHLL